MLQQFLESPRRHRAGLAVVCFGIFPSALCFHTLRSLLSNRSSYAVDTLCLLFSLMAAVLAAEMLRRSERVQRLVEERSRALGAAVASLEKAHRGLEENEARYRHLVENSPDAIVVEREGKLILANRGALEMFGFDPSHELEARSIVEFVAPEDREVVGRLYRQLSERAMQIPPQEIRVLRPDGEVLDAEFAASSFLHEGSQTIQIVVRDIGQRKHDEDVTARLFSAIEQVRESIVITDPEARIVYVNPAFQRVTGYSRQEAIGQNPRLLKSSRHSSDFYAGIWQRLTRGEVWSGRLVNRAKDGHLFTEEANIAPVFNRSGQLINYVAVKRDVTLETELQERLHQSQKMDAIGRLAGGVAHDFNNMLMVIVSYAELALESLDKDEFARTQISQVLRAAHRSFALTRQLLAFSRKQLLAPQVLDCNTIVSETSSMVRRLISENIELRCELASGLWPVKADPDQIMQVILNLCVNSRDAMPSGGSILLATRNDVERGYVEISVSDTGIGIPLDVQKKLFEPFFTTKEPGKGTGLGLATVYGIVQQSGGHIRVKSSPGRGSVFSVYLPRCREAEPLAEPPSRKPLFLSRGVILVVEDEDSLRQAIVENLRSRGYQVLAAANGVEALATLAHTPEIGIVVSDLIMPRMGGRELARLAAEKCPKLRFIYMSGHAEQAMHLSDEESGRAIFLQKPFVMSALLSAIAELQPMPRLPDHGLYQVRNIPGEMIH